MASSTSGLEIVVVDDNPAVLDALAMILEAEGFTVRTFETGEEFLAAARQMKPDCVILDVGLPLRSGVEVLQSVGGNRYAAPVIMISGLGGGWKEAAAAAGAYDCIEKPFDSELVVARVRLAARRRPTTRWRPIPTE